MGTGDEVFSGNATGVHAASANAYDAAIPRDGSKHDLKVVKARWHLLLVARCRSSVSNQEQLYLITFLLRTYP